MHDRAAVARWRSEVEAAWTEGDPPPSALGHRVEHIGGVRCLLAGPGAAGGAAGTVVYFHGGGYALGSPEVAVPITARLAGRLDVVSVGYRLSPEHPCPAAVEDGLAVCRVLRSAPAALPVALAGDSAGAGLALSVALAQRDRNEALPVALALLSPHLDHASDVAGQRPAGDDVDQALAEWLAQAYCGARHRGDPAVSPARAEPAGLPPVLVQVDRSERLLAQSVRFARRARLAGVAVTLDVWDGLWHAWHYHRLPEADLALAEVEAFLHRELAATGPPAVPG
jgi:acetyl esterase/lipase